jgi:hypothetical protein
MDIISTPRYEDFDITYHSKNPWAHLGMGYSLKNHTKDWSPYLQLENIDPKWMEAVGAPVPTKVAEKGYPSPTEDAKKETWDALTDGSLVATG